MSLQLDSAYGVVAVRGFMPGRRRFGVPVGGPWHRYSALVANVLAGNPEEAPNWEILRGSATFAVKASGTIAWVGEGKIQIRGKLASTVGGRYSVEPGDQVTFASDVGYVSFSAKKLDQKSLASKVAKFSKILRYVAEYEPGENLELIVSKDSSRAGVRLDGLGPDNPLELPSEPCCVGAIQRTPSGQLIIVGPDGPTIGGYSKIGFVLELDLAQLPYFKPNDLVVLEAVDQIKAREIELVGFDNWQKELSLMKVGLG